MRPQLLYAHLDAPGCAELSPSLRTVSLQTGRSNARYSREIVHTRKEGWYFSSSEEPPNNLLQQVRPPPRTIHDSLHVCRLCHTLFRHVSTTPHSPQSLAFPSHLRGHRHPLTRCFSALNSL